MKIIRDEETFGIMMIPLLIEWGIRRCNVKNCTNEPSTIITNVTPEISLLGLCEIHYKEMADAGRVDHMMVFDTFDAFEFKKQQNEEHDLELLKEMRKEMVEDDNDREDEIHNARYGN